MEIKDNMSDANTDSLELNCAQNKKYKNKLFSFYIVIFLLFIFSYLGSVFLLNKSPLLKSASKNSNSISLVPSTLSRPINVLILGIDNSGHPHSQNYTPAEAMSGNSDTMLLVRLIPDTHQINVLSIPRDTLVQIPGKGIDKINDANCIGGGAFAAKSVSQLLGNIQIDRYIRLDTEGFIKLVDVLGDVELKIPKSMHYTDKTQNLSIDFTAGMQKLSGQHLEEYVRFRHDALGDIGRVQRQQEVLKALLNKLIQVETIAKLPQLISVVKDNVDTDLSVGEMLGVLEFSSHVDKQHMNLIMLPGRFSERSEYPVSYWIKNDRATLPILAKYFDVHNNTLQGKSDYGLQKNNLKIAVIKGTENNADTTKTMGFLSQHGYNNIYVTRHDVDNSSNLPLLETQIIAQQGNVEAANMIKELLGTGKIIVESIGDISSDITVIVGKDLANKL